MKTPTLLNKIFREDDFNNADPVDQILISMLDRNHSLDFQTETYKANLISAYQIQCKHYTSSVALKLIMNANTCNYQEAIRQMHDSQRLFGSIMTRNTLFDKLTQRERILHELEALDNLSNHLSVDPQEEEIIDEEDEDDTNKRGRKPKKAELEDLYKHKIGFEKLLIEIDRDIEKLQPKEKAKPITMPTIKLSADPSVLAKQAQNDSNS